jgi:KDO2-lipid IV(A) lauroyltransferase
MFLFVKTLMKGFAWLSLREGHRLGRVLGACWWAVSRRSRRITLQNIDQVFPQLSAKARTQLARESLIETTLTGIEIAQAWVWPREKSLAHITRVENEALFVEAINSAHGVIVLAPHLGNWEWFNIYLASKTNITALYEPAKSGLLDQWIHKRRESSSGSHMVPTTREGIVALYKTLKSGGAVGILPDQEPEFSNGEYAPFFGIETLTMTLASRLAQKTGADEGFEVIFHKAPDDIYSEDLKTSVAVLNAVVEKSVRLAPTQYQWEYNRFKKSPENLAKKAEKRAIRRAKREQERLPKINGE